MRPPIDFLGLSFSGGTREEVEGWILARNANSSFGYIVTPNVDHVVRTTKADDAIKSAYMEADLCVCDSRVLRRLASMWGITLNLIPGSDLVEALFDKLLKPNDRICLVGGTTEHSLLLQARYPHLAIIHHEPPMGLSKDAAARSAVIDFAHLTDARIILLGVGSPQQELLAHEMAKSGKVCGTALCIGASIDFLVGAQVRAPQFLQNAGLEWAWRLMSDPKRLAKRYLVEGPSILPMVLKWGWNHSRRRQ